MSSKIPTKTDEGAPRRLELLPRYTTEEAAAYSNELEDGGAKKSKYKFISGAEVEDLIELVERLLIKEGNSAVLFLGVHRRTAEEVYEALTRHPDRKLRFEWDATSNQAIFRMGSTSLHGLSVGAFTHGVAAGLEEALKKLYPCNNQRMLPANDTTIHLENGSKFDPDACFAVWQGDDTSGRLRPRVVVEMMVSQSLAAGQRKAKQFLAFSDGEIHIVILINIYHRPTKTDTVGSRRCRAEIEIWERTCDEGGEAGLFLLDDCEASEELSGEARGAEEQEREMNVMEGREKEARGDKQDREESAREEIEGVSPDNSSQRVFGVENSSTKGDSLSSFDDEGVTLVDDQLEVQPEAQPEVQPQVEPMNEPKVCLRGNKGIVVFDEAVEPRIKPEQTLTLDVYDFVRVCNAKQDHEHEGSRRSIELSLEPLSSAIRRALVEERRRLGIIPVDEAAENAQKKRKREAEEERRRRLRPKTL